MELPRDRFTRPTGRPVDAPMDAAPFTVLPGPTPLLLPPGYTPTPGELTAERLELSAHDLLGRADLLLCRAELEVSDGRGTLADRIALVHAYAALLAACGTASAALWQAVAVRRGYPRSPQRIEPDGPTPTEGGGV